MKMKARRNAGVHIGLRQQGDAPEMNIENMRVYLLCGLLTNHNAQRKRIQTTTHFLRETAPRKLKPAVL